MASVSYQIANLLEKMTSSDKDFRFMATNDLMSELQKDSIKLDDDSERKVVKMLLKLLEDKNGEVQNLAVKCLGPLVNKVKDYQVETIVDALCTNMVSEKEQLRDISSIGLKTVISELPVGCSALVANVCRRVTSKLSSAIEKQEDVSVQLEALDIVADLLSRFGALLVTFHPTILSALLPQLSSQRQAVRKRTIVALSHLLTSSNNYLYNKLLDHLLEGLQTQTSKNVIRTYIQCIASICRQAGHRFGEQIERVMPLIVQYSNEDDDELREYCLQAFESFVYRCPKEITPHINKIIEICLIYITYDPNYNYDDDVNDFSDGESAAMEVEEDGEEDAEDEYSDDDDMSWKVRRAAAKCLEAVVSSRRELLSDLYKGVSPALIARFKEREENVKSDIFHAYIALLRQTRPTTGVVLDPDAMEDDDGPISLLQQQVPLIVKAVHRQMKEKSIKTRQDCFSLLKELVLVLPGALTNHIPALIPGIQYSLGDKNSSSNMKIDTLAFVHTLLMTHQPEAFHVHMPVLAPPIILAVGDSFYKIAAEALLVLQQLVQVIRPHDKPFYRGFTSLSNEIYHCTLMRLKTADIDQEVKERAIACMGQILAHFGDTLSDKLHVCLPIFLDRLRNEITRLTTVKALTCIAASPLRVDLKPIMEEAIPILGSFLRKNQRALKLSSLPLLDTLVCNYSSSLHPDLLDKVTTELPALLNESDLHIAQLTLNLLTTIAKLHPAALTRISEHILPEILTLVKSPLLQGVALNSMLEFFQALVQANLPGLGYRDLLAMLIVPVTSSLLHKQAYHSLAKCAAALTITWHNEAQCIVQQLLKDVQNPSKDVQNVAQHIFALLVIGEIGRHVDLSGINSLKHTILNSFSSSSEEVKSAASYTLGNIAIGNLPEYLPFILQEIEAQPKRQYLLLHSLKEIITSQSASPSGVSHLQNFVPSIWMLLYRHCECTEEGTRNVVAECLGKLTLIDPATLLPRLQESLKSPSALMRTTTVTAVKFTISDQVFYNSCMQKELIREVEMGPFKHTVDDGLDLRKAAFECMYTLLDSCLDRLDVFEFLNHVENGLRDHYDIKMLTYLMTARLAQLCPTAVLQRLERLVEPLKTTCTMKVKANSVKQEYEKQDELKRSALRAVAALLTIPDADKNPSLSEFVGQIKATPELQPLFEIIQKDCTGNNMNEANAMDQS
ncbi:cullin-associated NEDD8-dissociated protein 1 [Pogonomyrmex barbatus]|uniref:Cullin-associated NEDD8-dissociated protein 1 n=1 Tax=Pogonomyrmex barbatus TaxID=144034 RepID=A0A8N1S6U9_9HYME|nr:cullin-associated NEDD8-dissociated protein 1 [Pogonomyrmex barbatus]